MLTRAGWLTVIRRLRTDGAVSDVFVFLGSYANAEEAEADYDAVKELHAAGRLRSYDAALLARDAFGHVHIEKDELPTRHGAWTGAAVAAVLGLLLPPNTLVAGTGRAGAAPLGAHFRRGLSDADLGELGDVLQVGQTGLVVVAGSKVGDLLDQRLTGSIATVEKVVAADADLLQALKASRIPAAARK